MGRTISIRLVLEEAVTFYRQLEQAGVTGGAAFDKLRTGLEGLRVQSPVAVAAALDKVTAAASRAETATAQLRANNAAGITLPGANYDVASRAKDIEFWGQQIDAVRGKFVPLDAAAQKSVAAIGEINQAFRLGMISAGEAGDAIEKASAKYRSLVDAARQAAEAQREASAALGQSIANGFADNGPAVAGQARSGVKVQNIVQDRTDYESRAADIAAFGAALDAAEARFDPLVAAAHRWTAELNEISAAEKAGAISASQAAAARTSAGKAYDDAREAVTGAKAAADALAKSEEALRQKYVLGYAASKQYESSLDEITAAEKAGVLSASQAAGARDRLTQAFATANDPSKSAAAALGQVNVSAGAAAASMRGLGIQFVQGVSGIASGQPVLTTLIQQGHQVVDTSLAMGTGFAGIATAAKGLFAAVGGFPTVIGGAAVAAIVALGVAADHEGTRLANLRQELRATQENYAALAVSVDAAAKRVAATTAQSTIDARAAAQAIASAKYFAGTSADIESLTKLSGDLARLWATDVAKAAGVLRDAINDPAAAAKKFAEQGLPAFNAELVRSVERMQAGGQGGQALALVLEALRKSSTGAAQDVTPLQKALHELEQSFYGAQTGGKSLATTLGNLVDTGLTGVVNRLTEVVTLIKGLEDSPVINSLKLLGHLPGGQPFSFAGTVAGAVAGGGSTASGVSGTSAAGGAGSVSFSPDLTRVAPDVAVRLGQIAAQNGFTDTIANLASRVIYQESRGQQIDPRTGGTLTSSAGALGLGQLLPGTARQYGVDPNNADQNLLGTLKLLQDLVRDPQLPTVADVLGAYNAGKTGYLRAKAAGTLPAETSNYIADVTGVGRKQSGANAPREQYGPPVPAGLRNDSRAASDEVAGLVSGTNARSAQDLADKVRNINVQLERLRGDGKEGTAEYRGLQEQLNKTVAEQNQLLSPQEKHIRGLQDTVAANQGVFEGDQKILAERQKMAQIERDEGGRFSAAQRIQAESLVLADQSQGYKKLVANIELGIDANTKLTAAYGQGYAAVAQVTAQQQAYGEALKLFPKGSEQFKTAVADLTDEYLKQAKAAQEAKVAASTRDQQDQLAYIQQEISLVGASAEVRTRELAVFKARQELEKSGIAISEEAKSAYLASIAAVADGQSRLSRINEAFTELQNIGTQAFDRIGSAITQAFSAGGLKAVDFGGIVKGVLSEIAQYLLKMAVLNPLLNALFGSNKSTISDIGGLLGGVFGNAPTLNTSDPFKFTVGGNAGDGLVYNAQGRLTQRSSFDAGDIAALGKTGTVGADGQISLSTVGSVGLTAAKALDFVSGGKLLSGVKSYVFDAVGFVPGQSIGSWVSSLIGESVSDSAIAAAGVADAAVVGSETAATVAGEAATGAIGAAVNTIADALPYIGAAITVVTDLATGNFRGAAIVSATTLAGAYIGSLFGPGPGTAIGAGVGAVVGVLIDTFLPHHPLHPYQDTEVDVKDGRIVSGKRVSQIEDTSAAAASVDDFGQQLDLFIGKVGLRLTNIDSAIGHVGNNITGLEQVDGVDKLFNKLDFAPDPNAVDADSNFGIARAAVVGKKYDTVSGLTDDLLKIARFADGMDQLQIKLGSVGTDLTNISIASVGVAADTDERRQALSARDGPTGLPTLEKPDPLRVALAHDLPGQVFANVDALSAEIDKVNGFVNGTIPGLLNPILESTSQLQQQVADTNQKYGAAIIQAEKYGLDTGELIKAQEKADNLILGAGRKQLDQQAEGVRDRIVAAGTGSPYEKLQASLADFQVGAAQQRDALIKSLTDVYGESVKGTGYYFDQLGALDRALDAEAKQKLRDFTRQQTTNGLTIAGAVASIIGRAYAVAGDQQTSDLVNFDAKAAQERDSYSNQLLDFYGASYATSLEYQQRITLLERVQQGERLAIVTKYADQAKQAADQVTSQARTNVAQLLGGLATYARSLETGTDNPASPLARYDNASREFNAVSGAAAAGDYASAGKLQDYAQALLSASRDVNGSGVGYAQDYGRVVNALGTIGDAADALTASAERSIAQEQTDKVVNAVTTSVADLKAEVAALRRELQQQQRAA